MSEIAKVFKGLPQRFNQHKVKTARTFYFSLGEKEKWTVRLTAEKCEEVAGEPQKDADRLFKASEPLLLDVWKGEHTPSANDILIASIKSNKPMISDDFMDALTQYRA